MKILRKHYTGRRIHIYVCGVKIASWRAKATHKYVPAGPVSCDIYNYHSLVERGTFFPHLVGIVISRAATIGRNCIIYQNVTIGSKDFRTGDGKTRTEYPQIGDNVIIYAGAVIIGGVKIGDNAVIGANAVVTHDVPANSIAVGVPARVRPA